MRILVYGAGVLGSYLAHVLVRGRNNVTIFARGSRVEALKKDGIVIRHYLQLKTTVDKVNVITTLQSDDVYDMIFVVMQYSDLPAVLPILADNQSQYIVFVGNNPDPGATQHYLTEKSSAKKHVAFGFQLSGGRREKDRMLCLRGKGRMDLGGLHGDLAWRNLIEKTFEHTNYKLVFYADMDAWLKSHIINILVMWYAAAVGQGDLRKATQDKTLLANMLGAMDEGFKVLETLGYTIIPANQVQFVRNRRNLLGLLLKVYAVSPFPKLIDSTPQSDEMLALNDVFKNWKQQASILTPNWDVLERSVQIYERNQTNEHHILPRIMF